MVYFLPFTRSELTKLVTKELDFWAKQVCYICSVGLTKISSSVVLLQRNKNDHNPG